MLEVNLNGHEREIKCAHISHAKLSDDVSLGLIEGDLQ